MPTIEEVIAAMPEWAGCRVAAEPIGGGLTNRNYRVEVDGTPYFVRVPGPATELLAIDRANELANTRAAARGRRGPARRRSRPALGRHRPGVAARPDACRTPALPSPGCPSGSPTRCVASTPGRASSHDFDMFRLAEQYLRVIDDRAAPVPDGYREHLPLVPRIEAALAPRPVPTVPCHNDLLAENYLDDGERLWIVDYEYSGNNDPTFELGNTCQELGFDDARIAAICAAYFGEATPARLARMRLQMIMSDVGWTLWAAIQAARLDDRLRLLGLGVERWARAAGRARRCGVRDVARRGDPDVGRAAERRPRRSSAHPRPGRDRTARPRRRPPATRSAKTSTSSAAPSATPAARRDVADRPLERCSRRRRCAAGRPRRHRSGPPRRRRSGGTPASPTTTVRSRRAGPSGAASRRARIASRPTNGPLSGRTNAPRPASSGVSSIVRSVP